MKKFGLFLAAVCAAVGMLTSCLGETENSQTLSNVPAVVSTASSSSGTIYVLNTAGSFAITSSALQSTSLNVGDCVMVSFNLDFSSDENANASSLGYYNASITSISKVDKFNMESLSLPEDTTQLLENERVLASAMNLMYYNSYLSGYLFLVSNIALLDDEEVDWHLFADMHNIEPTEEESGVNTYSLFLRVVTTEEPDSEDVTNTVVPNAYYARNFIDAVSSKEEAAGNSYFNLRIYYVSEINETTNTPVWNYVTWTSLPVEL